MSKILMALVLTLSIGQSDGVAESSQGNIMCSVSGGQKISSFLASGVLREELSVDGFFESYLFKPKSGKCIRLKDNLAGINAFLASEFSSGEEAERFVGGQLVNLLISSLATDCWILNRKLAAIVSKTKTVSPFKSNKNLLKYAVDPRCRFDGCNWFLRASILTSKGSVEKWEFSGKTFPLRVLQYRRESLAPEGAFASLKMM